MLYRVLAFNRKNCATSAGSIHFENLLHHLILGYNIDQLRGLRLGPDGEHVASQRRGHQLWLDKLLVVARTLSRQVLKDQSMISGGMI